MELFRLRTASAVSIAEKIGPIRFKAILPDGASEQNLEELIVRYPSLLNWSDVTSFATRDLLIVGRQPVTKTRKRADLFAVSATGDLVIVEVKRDVEDEKGRREAMEFQAIRYAAASRTLTAGAIIELFASYLESQAESGGAGETPSTYRERAVTQLCDHIADEDEILSEADLEDRIDPRTKQKIYLVAAGYEPDILSACAWLREHKIDIACFLLRPYKVEGQLLLARERLIPPPELNDFLVEMRPISEEDGTSATARGSRKKSDRPESIKWADDPESRQSVSLWKDVLVEATRKALQLGMRRDDLPMKTSLKADEDMRSPKPLGDFFIETNASSDVILKQISQMLKDRDKEKGFLQVVTKSGKSHELPE